MLIEMKLENGVVVGSGSIEFRSGGILNHYDEVAPLAFSNGTAITTLCNKGTAVSTCL